MVCAEHLYRISGRGPFGHRLAVFLDRPNQYISGQYIGYTGLGFDGAQQLVRALHAVHKFVYSRKKPRNIETSLGWLAWDHRPFGVLCCKRIPRLCEDSSRPFLGLCMHLCLRLQVLRLNLSSQQGAVPIKVDIPQACVGPPLPLLH